MAKTTGASIALSAILSGAAMPAAADLVVLQYHHVSDSTPSSTSTSVSLFKGQLDMIEKLGLTVAPLESATRRALAGELDDEQLIAITFDDAYDSVYETAAPLLEEKGYPYTVFVNTDTVGGRDVMTWEELAEIIEKEGVTIANHSKDHKHLVQRPDESDEAWEARTRVSLDEAQETLEQQLGSDAPLFAYPYGEFSDDLKEALSERGWLGYGQQSGAIGKHSSNTRLPRFPMANAYGQLNGLETKLTSRSMPIDADALPDGVIEDNPPELRFTLPESFDPGRLNCFASGQGRIDFKASDDNTIKVQAASSFNSRRFRYNCTYPAGNGSYYWLSQQWLDLSQPED